MERAHSLANWSKDPSTKVGCVVVSAQHAVAEGYNGFPRGADDNPILYRDRAQKYERIVHAEANAVAFAARYGIELQGSRAYVTFPTCPICAGLLIQVGITSIVVRMPRCLYCAAQAAGREHVSLRYGTPEHATYKHVLSTGNGPEEVPCALPRNPAWLERFEISKQLFAEVGIPVIET